MTALLVTRPAGAGDPLVADLRVRGYAVHVVPLVVTEAVPVAESLLDGFDWIVVTSAAGVRALPSLPVAARWAAVGPATARALFERGITPELLPQTSNGPALADAIPDPAGRRILLARADAAASDLPDRLRERGAEVIELAVYRTVEGPATSARALAQALADPELAAVIFASGSAVRGYIRLAGPSRVPAVSIGPRTTDAARAAGFEVVAEAPEQTAAALAQTVAGAIPLEVKRDA